MGGGQRGPDCQGASGPRPLLHKGQSTLDVSRETLVCKEGRVIMAKRWWTFNFADVDWSGIVSNTPFSAPWWLTGMTLTRMLLSFHFAGNVGGYSTTREFAFPAPLVYIGYDPFSDHNGDTVNPIDDRGDDWLYTELFPINFTMYQTPGPTTFVTLFGGADR